MSKVETLKDCCSFQEGYVNPSQKYREYFGGNIKWLRASDLNGFFVYDTEKTLSQKGFESAGASALMFKKDTLAISKSGTIGTLGILKDEMCGNRAVINIDVDKTKADLYYIFYLLKYKNKELVSKAHGSIQKNLYISVLEKTKLNHSDLSTQQKIAAVLTALDAKIELNARINAELESMAKTLYDYWFVQFAYPHPSSPKWDGTSVPFGGGARRAGGVGLVWNEALKREIPLGWEVDNIMRLGDLLGGGTPKTSEPSYWGGNIPFFTPKDTDDSIFVLNTMDYITEAGLESCSSRLYPKGTIFITARGTVGKINVASQDMAMNQSCYAIQAKPEINYYFLHQHSVHLVQYLKAKSNGSIFDAIVSNDIKLTPIVIPPLHLIQEFGEHTKGIYEKILVNKQESQTLTELRDWLLPMLMNGQVQVK